MSAEPYPPLERGEVVITPSGKLAKVLGWDDQGRCELRYLAEDDTEGRARLTLWAKHLRRRVTL